MERLTDSAVTARGRGSMVRTSIALEGKLDSKANACTEVGRLHHINTEFGVMR